MTSNAIVQKLWNYCNILRDDGLSYQDYIEQLTFPLFLKMADERQTMIPSKTPLIPRDLDWQSLERLDGEDLDAHYRHILLELAKESGLMGTIFRKAQNKIQDPAKLKRLVTDLIGREQWTTLGVDVKGDAYEGLLEKNAADVKGGAGQYFTPQALIQAIVDVMRPGPSQFIHDPACGTGGFLLAVHDYVSNPQHYSLDKDQKRFLKERALSGTEIVDGAARLCAMNLFLHGVGGENSISVSNALISKGSREYEMVLTNLPFGKKSSVTFIGEDGEEQRDALTVARDDFWATTSNKQLNFLQHVRSILKIDGQAPCRPKPSQPAPFRRKSHSPPTTYGAQQEGSPVLPRNKYIAIRDDRPKSKEEAKRPEFKECKFTTEDIITEGEDVGTIHKVCANPTCPVHHPKQQSHNRDDAKWKAEQEKQRKEQATIANTVGLRVLSAIGSVVPVRLMKRDLLSVIERLLFLMDENRIEMLARQHGIRQKRDDGGVKKPSPPLFAGQMKGRSRASWSRPASCWQPRVATRPSYSKKPPPPIK
jgi:N-6 DNA Methylase/HsdM N-terminal domain